MDVTYQDKVKIADSGLPRLNSWTDVDANEVKNAINSKVDKIIGKILSSNDFTNNDANFLDYLMAGIFLASLPEPSGARIRYNADTSKWEISNDGSVFSEIGSSDFDPNNIATFLRFTGDDWIGKRAEFVDGADNSVAIFFTDSVVYIVNGNNDTYAGIGVNYNGVITFRTVTGGEGGVVNEILMHPDETRFVKKAKYTTAIDLTSDTDLVYKKWLDDKVGKEIKDEDARNLLKNGANWNQIVGGDYIGDAISANERDYFVDSSYKYEFVNIDDTLTPIRILRTPY